MNVLSMEFDRICEKAKTWPQAMKMLIDSQGLHCGQEVGNDFFEQARFLRDLWDHPEARRAVPVAARPVVIKSTYEPAERTPQEVEQFVRALFGPYEAGWIEIRCLRFAPNETEAVTWGMERLGRLDTETGVRSWRKCFPLAETCQDALPLWQMAERASNALYDVYVGVLPRRTEQGRKTKDNIGQAGFIWAELDFDKQDGEAAALKRAQEAHPHMVVRSGGGLHCYWRLKSPLELVEETRQSFEKCLRIHQKGLGTDATQDVTRVLRLAGTQNYKLPDNPRKVELVLCSPNLLIS